MSARAYIQNDYFRDGVAIWLGRRFPDGTSEVVEHIELTLRRDASGGGVVTGPEALPSLTLPDDIARVLLDALAAHYGGTSEAQTLRKDYLAERARVDKMIDHLTKAATDAR